MKPAKALFAVVAALVVSLPALAQPVYKSTMPDGRVVYGPQPAPGAKKVETIASPPKATGATAITPGEKAAAEKSAKARADAPAGAGPSDVAAARKALEAAEAARAAGQEPLPGERIGTAGGKSRLTDDYFTRQKKLEADVEAARKQLDQAQGRGR